MKKIKWIFLGIVFATAFLTGCSSTPSFLACAGQAIANDLQSGNLAAFGNSVTISVPVIAQVASLASTELGLACNDGMPATGSTPVAAPTITTTTPP